jgi:putative SOS response-associated peptidase YedK
MPATYRLDAPAAAIARALGADGGDDPWEGGAVVPGGYAPVVIGGKGGSRSIVPRQWGVPPPPRGEHVVIHVRNLASPFWIGTLRHTEFRCLVPATGFLSRRVWHGWPGRPVMAFAGIWRDSEVPSFAILTAQAGPGAPVLPVILPPEHYRRWLSEDWKQAQGLVRACDVADLLAMSQPRG